MNAMMYDGVTGISDKSLFIIPSSLSCRKTCRSAQRRCYHKYDPLAQLRNFSNILPSPHIWLQILDAYSRPIGQYSD